MTTFAYPVTIRNLLTGAEVRVDALADTGSTFSMLPASLLAGLDVRPVRSVRAEIADGSLIELPIGYAEVEVDGEAVPTLCAFGAEGIQPVLGALAMEALLIAPDPVHRRFLKVSALLYRARSNDDSLGTEGLAP